MTRLKTMPLKVPNRILYEDKESHELYEMVSVDECAELMGVTVTKIEGLMFGFKLIKPKLNYVQLQKVNPKIRLADYMIILDKEFEEVRDYVAKKYTNPNANIKKVNRSYARHDKDY